MVACVRACLLDPFISFVMCDARSVCVCVCERVCLSVCLCVGMLVCLRV